MLLPALAVAAGTDNVSENAMVSYEDGGSNPVLSSQNTSADSADDENFKNYMRAFSSNIILLFILCISIFVLAALNIAGRKYSKNYYYLERFYLRVILIPAYSVMGILLVLISLFSIAVIGTSEFTFSGDIVYSFVFSVFLFAYAMSSLWLAYSIVIKKVYMFILGFEIATPVILMAFFLSGIITVTGDEFITAVLLPLVVFIALILVPFMHIFMIKKRRGSSTVYSPDKDEVNDAGSTTYPFDEDSEAIFMQAKKINSLPVDLCDKYMDPEFIGKGGTAKIFKVKRREDEKVVAVKIPINFDERTGKIFFREMNLWKKLDHKNIVTVYSVNILPVPYVEMEYCEMSLADIKKPLPREKALYIIKEIGFGILYAHGKGVIHRDIKPQNILLSKDFVPKLTDWGLGKMVNEGGETTKTIAFSLNYAAPEQVAPKMFGRSDERTDIFQAGVVFYELLTGLLPFSGEGVGEFSAAIINEEPKPPSYFDSDLKKYDRIVMKCLQKNPENRYRTMDELLNDLDRL
ncbi:tRNA A-37 threonylcarbamoyl transferase component Bud32 [Methanomicrobium sp. W14]|uniref:serine/threonine-protein kinase n=1 Tax=Methanomicrobium sp. W14 TaxID=2817839 RepID=UPI001AE6C943|nr:serine/threonine-protein kinase [Methanomicrobium sp. W14]MBP2132541.1 tRNA A-37 threonylcarbamoyl transferase component Bud32 [Methanomicrobium sp. W14]